MSEPKTEGVPQHVYALFIVLLVVFVGFVVIRLNEPDPETGKWYLFKYKVLHEGVLVGGTTDLTSGCWDRFSLSFEDGWGIWDEGIDMEGFGSPCTAENFGYSRGGVGKFLNKRVRLWRRWEGVYRLEVIEDEED